MLIGFVSSLVNEREEGLVALHLHNGPLKTHSGLEWVPTCQPRI